MKISVNVECTPEEARRFMGLPDVSVLNDAVVEEMTRRMQQNVSLMSPETMVQSWMSVGAQAQDAFIKLMSSGADAAMKGVSTKP